MPMLAKIVKVEGKEEKGINMIFSLALIFLFGLIMSAVCKKFKLPGIIGMMVTGIILGPFVLNLLEDPILDISKDLRQIALIIILIKAGLSLDIDVLKRVGRPALLMSFVPATFEICGYVILAPLLLPISIKEAALLGSVIAAVSPAVVVPRMVNLMEKGYGTKEGIPQIITAGSSCDDIFVIVLFTAFLGSVKDNNLSLASLIDVPISVVLGAIVGALSGIVLIFVFEYFYNQGKHIRNSVKVIIILSVSFLLVSLEKSLEDYVALSGLLAVITMSAILKSKGSIIVTRRLSEKFGKLWLAAELLLFVLVGAAVDIRYTLATGLPAIILILLCLIFRGVGVFVALLGTKLNKKERIFCIMSYMPKATVQAAIGSVPLAAGLPCGQTILSVAVLAILITAPIGAILIDTNYKKLLKKEDFNEELC